MGTEAVNEATVFIVDDDEAVRDSIFELCGSVGLKAQTFGSAQDYLDAFDAARPGCLVLDVRMARISGLALRDRLDAMGAQIPIVFISAHGDIGMAVQAVKAGAVDFVQKPYHEQQLLDAINEALVRDAARRDGALAGRDLQARMAQLTAREREVIALALQGLSSKLIARELGISHRTVELHRSHALERLGVDSVAELVRLGAGKG
jgi:two-component system response regulator DctR